CKDWFPLLYWAFIQAINRNSKTNLTMKMTLQKIQNFLILPSLLFTILIFTGCISTRKMDRFVSEQYNNQIPKQNTKKAPAITVDYSETIYTDRISSSARKTSKVLPLLFYWQW